MSLVHKQNEYVFTEEVNYEDKQDNVIVTFGYGSLRYIVAGSELSDNAEQLSIAAAAAQEIQHYAGLIDLDDEPDEVIGETDLIYLDTTPWGGECIFACPETNLYPISQNEIEYINWPELDDDGFPIFVD